MFLRSLIDRLGSLHFTPERILYHQLHPKTQRLTGAMETDLCNNVADVRQQYI